MTINYHEQMFIKVLSKHKHQGDSLTAGERGNLEVARK